MRLSWTRRAAAALGLILVSLLAGAPANAEPATGVDEVVAALGLTSEAADYVVLVDTSGSMNADGRYEGVRNELDKLVGSLDSDDRLSLLTFDSTVKSRFRGVVAKNRAAVLAQLPATASGTHTDIGSAIDAGLAELERPDTLRQAALILITDGELDAPGSPYESAKSGAWKALKSRAASLGADHQVAAYAVSLQDTTDARLLKKVFPRASEVTAGEVGVRFANVGNDLLRLQATEALRSEVAQSVSVAWVGALGDSLASGSAVDVQLEFTSPYVHVPVKVTDLTVQAAGGLRVEVTGLPKTVNLEPGETVTVPARATVTGSADASASVSLTAAVSSPWRRALGDLGLKVAPEAVGSAAVPAPPVQLPPGLLPLAGGIGALLLGAFLVLLLARMLLTPAMSGVLTFRRAGRDLADLIISGRRMKLAAGVASAELAGLVGTATGARGAAGSERAVRIDARLGEATARGLILDGGVIQLGDLEVTYTSGRRRILDKIGIPRPDMTES